MFSLHRALLACVFSCFTPIFANDACPSEGDYVQVLGSGGPELDDGAASSGYAIWSDGKIRVLIDVGTGTARNYGKTGRPFADVEAILFSHFHTDHSADFAAFIKNAFFEQRQNDLHLFGPTGSDYLPSVNDFVHRFIGKQGVFPYLSSYLGDNASYKIHINEVELTDNPNARKFADMTFKSIDAEHGPFPSLAWRIAFNDKSITFSGDNSGRSDKLIELGENSDILVAHNAVPETVFGIAKNLHMRPSRIGEIASTTKTKHLVLSHFMKRTQNNKANTEKYIVKHYDGKVSFAIDLACYAF